jgi:hypothetical protein
MNKYRVQVDIDRKGGDDDVETVQVEVAAANENAAIDAANAECAKRFGDVCVLGAWSAVAVEA